MMLRAILILIAVGTVHLATARAAEVKPRLLNQEATVRAGSMVPVRYQANTGLKPVVDVYDAQRRLRVRQQPLAEVGTSGIYQTLLFIDPAWGPGAFTIVVAEPREGTLDSVAMIVADGPTGAETRAAPPSLAALTGIRENASAVEQDLTAVVRKVQEVQRAVHEATRRAETAGTTVDVLTDRRVGGAFTVRQVHDAITDGVMAVLGRPSDARTIPTVFGAMAQLRDGLNALPADVTTAKAPADTFNTARGLLASATTSARQAVTLAEQLREELGAAGKSETLFGMLRQLADSLGEVTKHLSVIPKSLNFSAIESEIRDLSLRLKQVSGAHGIRLDSMYAALESATNDLEAIKVKMGQIRVLLEFNQEMIEKALDRLPESRPVIKTWLEPGSVIIKILVVNPSQTETKTVPVQAYLPKRVTSKDVISAGGLTVDYDRGKDLYLVHGEVILGPGESVVKAVEIADIWLIPPTELAAAVSEARARARRLAGTPAADQASLLASAIENRTDEIVRKQEETTLVPAAHIEAYEKGQVVLSQIQKDLAELGRLESRVLEPAPPP